MRQYSRITIFITLFLFVYVGVSTLFSDSPEDNANYYLGVLAKGYPNSLVVSEFKYANARVVSMKDNMVLFGINENTKLTTFLKNLPFLEQVYVDARDITDIKGDTSLKENPLVREFLFLKQKHKTPKMTPSLSKGSPVEGMTSAKGKVRGSPATKITLEKGNKKTAGQGNMALIDQLIREKAKKIRASKDKEHQE
ncbi:MAG: hypothetical protein PVH61_09680 [Candidatus Aminicenantes bacterium]|jgi:hypothetical protein